jgi:hypothetical protein
LQVGLLVACHAGQRPERAVVVIGLWPGAVAVGRVGGRRDGWPEIPPIKPGRLMAVPVK